MQHSKQQQSSVHPYLLIVSDFYWTVIHAYGYFSRPVDAMAKQNSVSPLVTPKCRVLLTRMSLLKKKTQCACPLQKIKMKKIK